MSRSRNPSAARARPTTRGARPQLYILLVYDGRDHSLRLVWTGFRSGSPGTHDRAALTGLMQALLDDSAEVDQPANVVVIPPRREHPTSELTVREVEVLQLIAQGKTSTDIAQALAISSRTVQTHINRSLRTLKARNRTEAILKAIQWGVIRLTSAPSPSACKTQRGRTSRSPARKR